MNITIRFTDGDHRYLKNVTRIQEDSEDCVHIFGEGDPKIIKKNEIKNIVIEDFYTNTVDREAEVNPQYILSDD
jgi:hypothetical protein